MTSPLTDLGLTIPVIAAPMSGGPTTPAMVVSAARAGGLGFESMHLQSKPMQHITVDTYVCADIQGDSARCPVQYRVQKVNLWFKYAEDRLRAVAQREAPARRYKPIDVLIFLGETCK